MSVDLKDLEKYNLKHKTTRYSLSECKEFLRWISSNIDFSENEGILSACFHYLEEYEGKLKNELLLNKPKLYNVEAIYDDIDDTYLFPRFIKGKTYSVLEETSDDRYVIINELMNVDLLPKKYFKSK